MRGLSTGARRTGLVAITLASIIAVVLPMRGSMPWDSGTGTGSGTGSGSAASSGPVILDPLVSMRRSLIQATDTEVLTYRTQAENPSYLRVSVLETFDGTTWRPREGLESGRDSGVALPANVLSAFVAVNDSNRVRGGDSYAYDISVTSLQNTFLPLPYPVSQIDDIRRPGLGLEPGPEHRRRVLGGHRRPPGGRTVSRHSTRASSPVSCAGRRRPRATSGRS